MDAKNDQNSMGGLSPPKVIADFGGRRKTYERRIKQKSIDHLERRNRKDRRSGFDRRNVFPPF